MVRWRAICGFPWKEAEDTTTLYHQMVSLIYPLLNWGGIPEMCLLLIRYTAHCRMVRMLVRVVVDFQSAG